MQLHTLYDLPQNERSREEIHLPEDAMRLFMAYQDLCAEAEKERRSPDFRERCDAFIKECREFLDASHGNYLKEMVREWQATLTARSRTAKVASDVQSVMQSPSASQKRPSRKEPLWMQDAKTQLGK